MKKKIFLLSVVTLMLGCSQEHKVEHELTCYVNMVNNETSGEHQSVTEQEAKDHQFTYEFKVYDDGVLIVNGAERYLEEKSTDEDANTHLYVAEQENKEKKMERLVYTFDADYSHVGFRLDDRNISYEYSCEPAVSVK